MQYRITKSNVAGYPSDTVGMTMLLAQLERAFMFELFGESFSANSKPEGIVELRAGSRVTDPRNTIEVHGDGEIRWAAKLEE